MTTRLQLYNEALMICGERSIASLSEDREPRRLLDAVWDNDGVGACLERGQWTFAMRASKVDYDVSITPSFGYSRAFTKPSDWKVTSAVCSDEYYTQPLLYYVDETSYWYSDLDSIYVKYVSNDASYGGDLSSWPAIFTDYVAAYFAKRIIMKLTADRNLRDEVRNYEKEQYRLAQNSDAMARPTQFPAPGGWVRSRGGRSKERGNRSNLIG